MRKRLLLLFPLAATLVAQTGLDGSWLGTLAAGAVNLRLVLKVTKAADGSLAAKLDSLDQGANDLPITAISRDGDTVRFTMDKLRAAYEGKLSADGSEMAGRWTQAGSSMPLSFKRTAQPLTLNRPQNPVKPYPYDEEEIVFENKKAGIQLAGTLTTPRAKGPHAAAVLISGSGPQDRDESLMGHKPFWVLADHLTRKGIAVLRFDDRGFGKSKGNFATATSLDFASDVTAAVEFLKTRPAIDRRRIGLIGHSEGGVIAPMVAGESPDIGYIVLMAGTGVPGDQVLRVQGALISKAMGLSDAVIAKNQAQRERAFAILREESDPKVAEAKLREHLSDPALEAQMKMMNSPWFRFFLTYDPATALRKVKCPVLAVNGELDLQVSSVQNLPAIAKALEEGGNSNYAIVKLPKLNHLFQSSSTGSVAEYGKIEETFSPFALETISGWITWNATER